MKIWPVFFTMFIGLHCFAFGKNGIISPAEALREQRAGAAVIIDVREPTEIAGGMIPGALLFSWSRAIHSTQAWNAFLAERDRRKAVIFYCSNGARAQALRDMALRHRLSSFYFDFPSWLSAGLPVSHHK